MQLNGISKSTLFALQNHKLVFFVYLFVFYSLFLTLLFCITGESFKYVQLKVTQLVTGL